MAVGADVTVGLDVLLCRERVGHLPRPTVPHSAHTHTAAWTNTHTHIRPHTHTVSGRYSLDRDHTQMIKSTIRPVVVGYHADLIVLSSDVWTMEELPGTQHT